eukprot:GFYU01002624.1.p1 GENE.GFYU01002624.1~~GFYU01002624.1.p1  ORF type:complete len:215 (-),score=51.22 GFYU01002624.1:141-785(-)
MTSELPSSNLGTQEHWDECYNTYTNNYKDHGDWGDCFFGEQAVEDMTEFLEETLDSKDLKLMDVGCGNGVLLFSLAQNGFTQLLGIDYSEPAIELANKIAADNDFKIDFRVADLRDYSSSDPLDVVTDIGTYDAVSLVPDAQTESREAYIKSVSAVLKDGGIFAITSCNWTKAELLTHFSEERGWEYVSQVNYPVFEFGGSSGTHLTTVAFRKK